MKSLSTIQKILIGLPLLSYLCLAAFLIVESKFDTGAIIFFPIATTFIVLLIFAGANLIHAFSSLRISLTGGVIIIVWTPVIILSQVLLWFCVYKKVHPASEADTHPSFRWESKYDGNEKIVADAGLEYLKGHSIIQDQDIAHYFMVKQLSDSTRLYAFYYFYDKSDINFTYDPSVILLLINYQGEVQGHSGFAASEDSVTYRLFQHQVAIYTEIDKTPKKDDGKAGICADSLARSISQKLEIAQNDSVFYKNISHLLN